MTPRYVTLVPLAYRIDDGAYVVGPAGGSTFVELPELGALITRALQLGSSIDEAAVLAAEAAGEPVELDDFLVQLDELGWVLSTGAAAPPPPREVGLRPAHPVVRALFGRAAWACYGLAAVFSALAVVAGWYAIPSARALLTLTTPAIGMLVMFVVGMVTLVIHEAWHWLAGRAAGIDSTVGISRRWLTPVAQTDLSRMWLLSRRARVGPLLAGSAIDLVLVAGCVGAQLLGLVPAHPVAQLVVGSVVFVQLTSIAFQLQIYMRTDGYALLTNAYGCRNLTLVARSWVLLRLGRGDAAARDVVETAHPRDLRALPVYLAVFVAGLAWTVWFAVAIGAPALWATLAWMCDAFRGSGEPGDSLQAGVVLLLTVIEAAWLAFAFLGERRARRRAATGRVAPDAARAQHAGQLDPFVELPPLHPVAGSGHERAA